MMTKPIELSVNPDDAIDLRIKFKDVVYAVAGKVESSEVKVEFGEYGHWVKLSIGIAAVSGVEILGKETGE